MDKLEKTAAVESAAERYLAYARKCNIPNVIGMLEKQIANVKTAGTEDPNINGNSTKVAETQPSIEEKLVDMVIAKYANEPKEKVLEIAKELGKLLDEGEYTEEDLTPENIEAIKNSLE